MANTFVLGQPELDALLASLAPGREQAGERYEAIRHRLVRYFEGHHCVPADERADETIDRVARRIAAGERIRAANPCHYFYGVARNVCLEWRKRQRRVVPLPVVASLDQGGASLPLSCLMRCLDALDPSGRDLLVAYYLGSRASLPAHLGVTPNALRIRVCREKQKLRACISRCLQRQRAAQASGRKHPAGNRH